MADFPGRVRRVWNWDYSLHIIPSPFVLFIVLPLFWVLLHHTTVGRSLYAIGATKRRHVSPAEHQPDEDAAFIASGVISALAGIVFTFGFPVREPITGRGSSRAPSRLYFGRRYGSRGKGTVTELCSLLLIGIY